MLRRDVAMKRRRARIAIRADVRTIVHVAETVGAGDTLLRALIDAIRAQDARALDQEACGAAFLALSRWQSQCGAAAPTYPLAATSSPQHRIRT